MFIIVQMSLSLLITILSFCISISALNNNAIFALTWMAGHCQYLGRECDKHKYDQWDHQSFTIHGFWPNQYTDHYYGNFDFKLLKGDLLQDMYNFWPPQPKTGGLPHFLWQYQWESSGKKFSTIMLQQNPANFGMYGIKKRNEELQILYFTKVIQYYKKLNVRKVGQKQYTKDQFSAMIKVPKESFYFVCSQSTGTFREVRICYKITNYGLDFRNCAKTTSNCKGDMAILKDWKAKEEIIIKQDPNKITDSQREQKLSKIAPIYIPAQQKKEDQSILNIIVQTNKPAEIKQELIIEEEKQLNIQIQLQEFNSQESTAEKDTKDNIQIYDKDQVVKITIEYMLITILIVSAFWIALIIICVRALNAKNIEEDQKQLKESESAIDKRQAQ